MTVIQCKNIVKAYRVADHELVALKGIDFRMEQGDMVAIVGPSGAGKSSLLNLLAGLDRPTAGKITVGDAALEDLRGQQLTRYRLLQVGLVWQTVARNLLLSRSALHNVMLPMMLAGIPFRQRRRRALDLLMQVGLADAIHKRPEALSGGQQQRVAIAVALANRPQLLLADEPTGALDRGSALQVMELLMQLRVDYQLTVLMVTHDPEMANFADRVLTLRDGALGQDVAGVADDQVLRIEADSRIQLPRMAVQHLSGADAIGVELRPEGVLLRPMQSNDHNPYGLAMPAAMSTKPKRWFGRKKRMAR